MQLLAEESKEIKQQILQLEKEISRLRAQRKSRSPINQYSEYLGELDLRRKERLSGRLLHRVPSILDALGTTVESSSNSPCVAMTSVGAFPFSLASTYAAVSNGGTRETATGVLNSGTNQVWMYLSTADWSAANVYGLKILLGSQTEV